MTGSNLPNFAKLARVARANGLREPYDGETEYEYRVYLARELSSFDLLIGEDDEANSSGNPAVPAAAGGERNDHSAEAR